MFNNACGLISRCQLFRRAPVALSSLNLQGAHVTSLLQLNHGETFNAKRVTGKMWRRFRFISSQYFYEAHRAINDASTAHRQERRDAAATPDPTSDTELFCSFVSTAAAAFHDYLCPTMLKQKCSPTRLLLPPCNWYVNKLFASK